MSTEMSSLIILSNIKKKKLNMNVDECRNSLMSLFFESRPHFYPHLCIFARAHRSDSSVIYRYIFILVCPFYSFSLCVFLSISHSFDLLFKFKKLHIYLLISFLLFESHNVTEIINSSSFSSINTQIKRYSLYTDIYGEVAIKIRIIVSINTDRFIFSFKIYKSRINSLVYHLHKRYMTILR